MSARCFRKDNLTGITDTTAWDSPCPNQTPSARGFVGCCNHGSACLADGICFYTHKKTGGSGFNVQSCTDPTYQDPACSSHCAEQSTSDVVFNAGTSLWACCGGRSDIAVYCDNPTNETFSATPLWPLLQSANAVVASPGASTQSTSTASPTSTSTGTSHPSTSSTLQPQQSSAGLSEGAKIGIGVGVGVGALVLLACLAWIAVVTSKLRKLQRRDIDSQTHLFSGGRPMDQRFEPAQPIEDQLESGYTYEVENRPIASTNELEGREVVNGAFRAR